MEPPGAPVHGPRMCAGTLRGPVAVFPSVSVAGSDPALCAHDLSAPQLVRSSVPDRPLHARATPGGQLSTVFEGL